MRFADKVAIITGAGTGIGRDMAIGFVREGARVCVAARRKELLEETADLAARAGGERPLVLPMDLTVESDVDAMADCVAERFGGIDFMINNAAYAGQDLAVQEQTLENWNQVIATNLTSQFLVARASLRHMIPRRSGVILTFSSTAALRGFERKSHYTASKLGIFGFTRTLALEVGRYGIRANTVVPGAVKTELLAGYWKRIAGERGVDVRIVEEEFGREAALGRAVEPGEVTKTVMFLCSDDASGITGQEIRVCAGAAMG
ncbi:MAG: SDR family NAD(P)-dependent oxidoreductase [Gemmatimonadales bacterium]|jgi:3-oxoacyl-[acyl-carrier protein] reductase